ncbi:carboxymuconolactone decarboxylase family protein [Neiella marina]|uniref:Carboxymuconolactone decarboxylase family protein n=1 Tax=Neiella holothuriorum TaxID=2870530 RepID=A0ABS7EK99_9GAMM|nr:carboxymuconolactone decarboxylase family protein [Neiella holothuriorum]MBW8192650.1 carboxymuconolactone decarboxylase family protein [Neiella holothuriorum]
MALLHPLAIDLNPELKSRFQQFEKILGFVPNSLLTMQRNPAILNAFGVLTAAVMEQSTSVDAGFKRLLAHMASSAAGCRYCQAHSLLAAELAGEQQQRLEQLWQYQTSPLFSPAERAALDFALAAGSAPAQVNEPIMASLRQHWNEEQIVELTAAISLYGFLNRWNDAMATTIEEPAKAKGEALLAEQNWHAGKHLAASDTTQE